MQNGLIKTSIIKDISLLTKPCEESSIDDGKDIVKQLIEVLNNEPNGAALAAPQIGIYKRVFVARNGDLFSSYINPQIMRSENIFINKNEGCLSFPGILIDTIRYRNVDVISGNSRVDRLCDFPAVVAQHELDHLFSILFFKRKVPEPYDECFCKSGKKFKFCCSSKLK